MKKLITYQALDFVDQVKQDSKFTVWREFYNIFSDPYIGINDRSNRIKFPIKTYIPQNMEIPMFITSNISYKDCCLQRANEIIKKQEELDLPIYIMYSGGIDSTTVLCSFINLLGVAEAAKRIKIVLSKESIDENPAMWHKFIRPYFSIRPSDFNYNEFDFGNWIYVTGELNDQLFGSDIQREFSLFGGDEYLNKTVSVNLLSDFFVKFKKVSEPSAKKWAELMIENLNSCPIHDSKVWDALWWYNFCWKWIYVYYRIFLFSKIEGQIDKNWLNNNYYPFFATDSFQIWSMNNLEPKHLGTWGSYKHTSKKYIFETLKDNEYMNKIKKQSLQNIVNNRPRTRSITDNYEIIDNKKIDFNEIFEENNNII